MKGVSKIARQSAKYESGAKEKKANGAKKNDKATIVSASSWRNAAASKAWREKRQALSANQAAARKQRQHRSESKYHENGSVIMAKMTKISESNQRRNVA